MGEASAVRATFPDSAERVPAILVVEDEVLIRLVISDYLRECGFKVYEAGTAAEALEIIGTGNTAIDLVFSDVRMPGAMDGFGLAQWVRRNRPGLPVILTSGDAKKSEAAKDICKDDSFFAKPYELDPVVQRIRAMIGAPKLDDPAS